MKYTFWLFCHQFNGPSRLDQEPHRQQQAGSIPRPSGCAATTRSGRFWLDCIARATVLQVETPKVKTQRELIQHWSDEELKKTKCIEDTKHTVPAIII